MRIVDRYSHAVHSTNLRSHCRSAVGDIDMLGAAGFAARRSPLSVALLRLYVADDQAASSDLVGLLGGMLVGKAWHGFGNMKLPKAHAADMARAVLAWHRDGACKACRGLKFTRVEGAPSLSGHSCQTCGGSGKMAFDKHFAESHRPLVRWLVSEIEREEAMAGGDVRRAAGIGQRQ